MIGKVLGRVQIEAKLGQGSMGLVYRGKHLGLGREVAVKVLLPEIAADARQLERFRNEAIAVSRLEHPNVVRVLDYGVEPEHALAYLVMELLRGRTLERWIDEQPEPNVAGGLAVLRQVLDGLTTAHAQGIVHRDIKPGNIFLADSPDGALRIKLLDFGLARVPSEGAAQHLTKTGEILGTPAYMSPEQVLGKAVDRRSDVYSLGCVAYHVATGQYPFRGNAYAMMMAHVNEPATPPSRVARVPNIEVVDAIVMRALEKDPARRFADAEDMRGAVEHAVAELNASTSGAFRLPRRVETDLEGLVTEMDSPELEAAARAALSTAGAPPAARAPRRLGVAIAIAVGVAVIALGAWLAR